MNQSAPHPPQALTQAQASWQRGDLIGAEVACRRALLHSRTNSAAHALLADLLLHAGQLAHATEAGRQWAASCPTDAAAHTFLGDTLARQGQHQAAMTCWQHALHLTTTPGALQLRLGRTLVALGDDAAALAAFEAAQNDALSSAQASLWRIRVLYRLQRHDHARQALGHALFCRTAHGQADEILALWRELFPHDAVPQHRLAAQGALAAPPRASDDYLTYLFDHYAETFDAELTRLGYQAPALLAEQLAQSLPPAQAHWRVLDAGCGTGLCGAWLRPYARVLTGVDLSGAMVAKARARGGYDQLVVAELTQFLTGYPAGFELIVSADTLIYFGDLRAVLSAAAGALVTGGHLAFSLELQDASIDAHWHLSASGRYQHAQPYVRQCVQGAGLHLLGLTPATLRMNDEKPVHGLLVLASKP